MKFDTLAKSHLSNYKVNNLNIEENGDFNNIQYEYIVPSYLTEENFISYYRDNILNYIKTNNIILNHTNHLNSSQAMGFNFFYPIIEENKIELLNKYLDLNIDQIKKISFEEKMADGTIVDLYLESATKNVLFEIKYTEQDFGSKTYNPNSNNFYTQLINKNFLSLTKDEFYRYYQLFRYFLNVINNNNLFIVVFPRKNIKLEIDFNRFITILNNKLIHKYDLYKVRKIHLEELYDYVYLNIENNQKFRDQLNEFKIKYLF